MKKIKVMSILLAFCLIFSSTPVYAADVTSIIGAEYYELKMALQENALVAYELFWNSLEKAEDGEALYPDTYAGCYIKGNKLYLNLTDVSNESINYYLSIFKDYAKYVEFNKKNHSYNYLQELAEDKLTDLLYKNAIVEYCVSSKDNKIIVGVSPNAVSSSNFSSIKNDSLFEFVEVNNTVPETIYLNGGDGIRLSSQILPFTLGYCGTYNGNPAIVTCGHGSHHVGDIIVYDSPEREIGEVVFKRYSPYVNGDFSIIKVTNGNMETTNVIANTYTISGVYANPPVGTTVKKYGVVSLYGYGTVEEIGYENSNTKGLTKVELSHGSSTGGDSGGPYFVTSGGQHLFCGVHHGSHIVNGSTFVYFTPYTYINAMGFVAKRN